MSATVTYWNILQWPVLPESLQLSGHSAALSLSSPTCLSESLGPSWAFWSDLALEPLGQTWDIKIEKMKKKKNGNEKYTKCAKFPVVPKAVLSNYKQLFNQHFKMKSTDFLPGFPGFSGLVLSSGAWTTVWGDKMKTRWAQVLKHTWRVCVHARLGGESSLWLSNFALRSLTIGALPTCLHVMCMRGVLCLSPDNWPKNSERWAHVQNRCAHNANPEEEPQKDYRLCTHGSQCATVNCHCTPMCTYQSGHLLQAVPIICYQTDPSMKAIDFQCTALCRVERQGL